MIDHGLPGVQHRHESALPVEASRPGAIAGVAAAGEAVAAGGDEGLARHLKAAASAAADPANQRHDRLQHHLPDDHPAGVSQHRCGERFEVGGARGGEFGEAVLKAADAVGGELAHGIAHGADRLDIALQALL